MRLPEIDRLRLTSVVDNFVDPLLKDEGPAKRRPRGKKAWEHCSGACPNASSTTPLEPNTIFRLRSGDE